MGFVRRLLERFNDVFVGRKAGGAPPAEELDFAQLGCVLQYTIRNKQLFREAFSHRSYLQLAGNKSAVSNERLEFLGDSVLNLVVAEFLFRLHPTAPEGDLTKIRSRLVNRKALTTYGRELGLESFLLMSPNAMQLPGRGMETIIADAYEAVIGAMYLDGGYQQTKQFAERCLATAMERGGIGYADDNFKSRLLELAQAGGFGAPRYVTIHKEGPEHDRTFTVEVFVGNASYGTGYGKNKKDAEQAAAEQALRKFDDLTQ
jgi:ribonuclease-3